MALEFIPQPKKITRQKGTFNLPRKASIAVCSHELLGVAEDIRATIDGGSIVTPARGVTDPVTILTDGRLKKSGYRLAITREGIAIRARDKSAAFHAAQTVGQIVMQSPRGKLPLLIIDDWPDFADRGVYYDLARGRVPKLERLMEMADLLSRYKVNQLQLYIEHTFCFRTHPGIGKDASPLTAEDIMELDAYCRERNVELLPSLSTFGHLATVLSLPEFRHLAEMCGEGGSWSLAPANEQTYVFLDDLFSEFLPCFSSERVNVCCDEVWDLGAGQSSEMARKMGKGGLYLYHIRRLRELAAKHGKKILMWGDIIRNYPELIAQIPRDVTCLDWHYEGQMDFDRVKDFAATGLATYVCPSVCGYVTLFPRIHESAANIAGWAREGKKYGAVGLLNTDWGDGGHYNFMECAWPGYLMGAEQSWNVHADRRSFWRRFCKLFLGIEDSAFSDALEKLGEVTHTFLPGWYQSMWRHVFFAGPDDEILKPERRMARLFEKGEFVDATIPVNAAYGRKTAAKLRKIRNVFKTHASRRGADPHQVMPYWLFAVDALIHATDKLAVLGKGGKDTPASRRRLKAEMKRLKARFEKLWMARNRRSEIRITLRYFRRVIREL
jgi:hypothetical protein